MAFLPWRRRRRPRPAAGPAARPADEETAAAPAETHEWALIAHVSDLHVNSTVALCPRKFPRDDGGIYYPSRQQLWILECWEDFWDTVAARRERMQAEAPPGVRVALFVIVNGDAVDLNRHSKYQLVEYENPVPILDAAEDLLDRPTRMADAVFIIRGTEAHTGGSGFLEEGLALRLGAEPDPDRETYSWYHLACEIAGVGGDFCHHPATSSRRLWTLESAASRQAAITWAEYHEAGEDPPQVVGRAHTHQFTRGWRADTFCFFSPPWQITTSFGHRLGAGRRVVPIGGVLIDCRDGVAEVELVPYKAAPGCVWHPPAEVYRVEDGEWTTT